MNTVYILIEKENLDSMGGYSKPNDIIRCFDSREKAEEFLYSNYPNTYYNFYIQERIIY